jgi:maleate isomerase
MHCQIQNSRNIEMPEVPDLIGTDLVITRLADEAERWLRKPIIAVNAAMLWHALRSHNINDRLYGFGSILRIH